MLKNIKMQNIEICKVQDINLCISKIILKHRRIDIIKVDNEGEEVKTISRIDKKYWKYKLFNVDGEEVSKFVPNISS